MKYEITSEAHPQCPSLRRIRALRDIPRFGVTAGELGGYIETANNLAQIGDAWVSGNAQVYGNALVYGNAWVYGDAQVYGNALLDGDARVSGNAQVFGNARVYGGVWVYGDARVSGNAQVYGNALVYGNAWVYGDAQVYGNALLDGDARVSGNAQVFGNARVSGNALVKEANITATRSDGYTFLLTRDRKTKRCVIIAGCRYFTFAEARKHWRKTRGGTKLGDETFAILRYFAERAKLNGWRQGK